ncbi:MULTISPECIES: tripartite tricarboxylate transporter TctB family protein [unclassified Paenibacillus]|uniref:tripartite tricarboxylate transporter TctB family protein n=1 Tax=unclassified Paenibacillus TaxID=185978 RepID=UPI001AEB01A5|nr:MULTISPECIES: tripartite tricarboxylate transporter TctB family protein [unclassified Paenibacillus]MBP1153608.1 hypothetical protein [Paenibacillus sp. PvP091]MBP1171007.1 hypothetical protein [Paenibacillus sp. PvR098]MBP2442035.1 hypothetical protein [Paenibacillus sp. PvP052]
MRNAGLWASLLLLVFSIFMFWQSLSYPYYTSSGPGPGFLPRWIGGALIVLSLLYMWESIKKSVIYFTDILPKGRPLISVLVALGSLLVFIAIVGFAGFVISAIVLLFISLVREYKWYSALGISIVTSLFVFYVFYTLLGVPLPVNALGW